MTEAINYDPGFWTKTSWIQLGYGVWVSLAMVGIGLALNFPAVTIPQLKNDQDFEVTLSDEAWIASVLNLVSPIGCIVCGYLIDKCGRRVILIMCELPMCLGWIYTGYATSSIHMILGRVLTGVGVGMAIGAPRIFITEISLPNMRGVLGAFPNVALSIGLTLLATCGVFMQWTKICLLAATFTFILLCCNLLIPETPYYTLMKSSDTQALANLKKFRSSKHDTNKEISDMIDFKAENDIRRLSFRGEMSRLITKGACKPFCIIITYMLFAQLTGVTVMFVWTIDLLQGSKMSTDAGVGNVVLGVTRFLAAILSSILLYRIKRRPQALISSIGAGLTCVVLASYIQYAVAASLFPLVCFVLYVIFATLGHYTLPLLIMYELYPLQIRGLLGGISSALLNLFIFGTNKFYPYLRNWIGHANVILCFGICSLLGSIFLYLYLPETMGLTLQEIEEYFNDRRSTLVSQRNVLAQQLSSKGSSMLLMSPSKIQLSKTHHKPEEKVSRLQLRRKKKMETEDAEPGTSTAEATRGTTDKEEKSRTDQRQSKDATNTKK